MPAGRAVDRNAKVKPEADAARPLPVWPDMPGMAAIESPEADGEAVVPIVMPGIGALEDVADPPQAVSPTARAANRDTPATHRERATCDICDVIFLDGTRLRPCE